MKNILRYFSGTSDFGLGYRKGSACCLVGSSDSDYAGCNSDLKSTSVTCHLFGNCLVSWHSKKQYNFVLSITEAGYVAVGGTLCSNLIAKTTTS